MRQLVCYELSKLLKKRIVSITLTVYAVIVLIMFCSWISGSEMARTPEGITLYNQEAEDYNEEIVSRYEEPLTDEKVSAVLLEFAKTEASSWGSSNHVYSPVQGYFTQMDGTRTEKSVEETFPEFQKPPLLGRSTRWESLLYSMRYMIMLTGVVLIIIVSPVFSDEYSSGMDALILTAINGRHTCVKAKITASFLLVFSMTGTLLLLGFLMFYIERGFTGWNADIQLSELLLFRWVTQPLPCYEAALMMAAASFFSMLTLNGLVLIFSVISRSSFASIVAAAVVYLAPMFLNAQNPIVKRLLLMMPVNSSNIAGLLSIDGISVGGWELSMLLLAAGLMLVVIVFSILFSRKSFSSHQVV